MYRAIAALLLMTVPAAAQTVVPMTVMVPCMNPGAFERQIAEKYGESPVGAGISKRGIIVVLSNPETGTFSIMLRSGELTCLVSSGTGYAITDPKRPGENL